MEADAVLYETRRDVALITLNRPARRNALSRAVREGIRAALERADADSSVAVAVLTGAGDKAFCAGGDLEEMAAEALAIPPRGYMPIARRTVPFEKVLIAAVNGAALGGGFLLAQMADLAIAAEGAIFGMPEVRVGRGAPWSVPLSRMIPQRIWMEMCLTGEPITARRAYEIGLVNAVVPEASVLPTALRMAERIASNAPLTVRASHRMVHLAGEMGVTPAWDAADALFEPVYGSDDAKEGPRAFRERRPPEWRKR
jgi:enoyl-CoA hydratase/carnithine racemase